MKTSPRPKAKPMKTSPRPKANPLNDRMSPKSIEERSTRAMAGGGKCRGMGAASKGGKYSKAG
jgi:hypothetical protein